MDTTKYTARYSGPNKAGICKCGHEWQKHHLGMVARQEYIDQTGEGYIAQECEAYGFNEMGGLDQDGNYHCDRYIDMLDGR